MISTGDIDIQRKAPQIRIEGERSDGPSPHLVDLTKSKIGGNRHEQPLKVQDIAHELNKDLRQKKGWRYEENHESKFQIPSRFTEGLRMMAIGVFVVFTLNIIGVYYEGLKLKDGVATAAYTTYNSVLEEGPSSDVFEEAQSNFEEAQESLWFLQNQRAQLKDRTQAASAVTNLLTAGEALAQSGESFMAFVDEARGLSNEFFTPKVLGQSVTDELKAAYEKNFIPALNELTEANEQVQRVNSIVFPSDLRPIVIKAQNELGELTGVLQKFNGLFPVLLGLLGDQHPQRYLILLENNNEARPGGGFIGSYLILDLNDGHIDGLDFNDVYDLDNRFYEDITPPAEIARLTQNWRFRDSNYSPDLAVSSAKGAWFLEKEGGPGVDHVLTVDLTFVNELLALTGPIKLDQLPIALAQDNFGTVLSFMVESKLTGKETPKDVLSDFIVKVEEKLREKKPWGELFQLMQSMASSKHLSAYSENSEAQAFFEEFGLAATVPVPQKGDDTFMMIHTSVGGNKTDPYITQDIHHKTNINEDGSVQDQVTMTRTHTWTDTERLRLKNLLASFGFTNIEPWLIDLLGGGPNVSMMRVYAPHGSKLMSTSGIEQEEVTMEYDRDLNLTYFTFTDTVYPGKESTITLTYELPDSLDFSPLDEYRLNVIKQPGDMNTTFTKTITGDFHLTHYRSFPEALIENAHEEALGVYTYTTELNHDLQMAQLWGN